MQPIHNSTSSKYQQIELNLKVTQERNKEA